MIVSFLTGPLSWRRHASVEQVLRQLISEYGTALHLPSGDNSIAAHMAKEIGLAKGTILGILNGSTERLSENTKNKLATFFNSVAVPKIHPAWLSSRSLAWISTAKDSPNAGIAK